MSTRNVINILVSYKGYASRFEQFFELDRLVDQNIIITRDPVEVPEWSQNTKVIHANGRGKGLRFWLWAAKVAGRVIQSSEGQTWIVHEHFLGLVCLQLRLRFGKQVKTIVSAYMPHLTYLRQRGWRADPWGGKIAFKQDWFYGSYLLRSFLLDIPAYTTAMQIVVNSQMIADEIKGLFPRKIIHILPTSVTINHRILLDRTPSEAIFFLYVGILQPAKGIGTLLAAFKRYLKTNSCAKLILIGRQFPSDRDWFAQLLEHYFDIHEYIQVIDHISSDELISYYNSCDIFVFPSFYEGSPRVVKEALACGCPVIASDLPGIRLIDPDGDVIQYCPIGDHEAFYKKMALLGNSPQKRKNLGEEGFALMKEFTSDKVAKQVCQVYEQLWVREE